MKIKFIFGNISIDGNKNHKLHTTLILIGNDSDPNGKIWNSTVIQCVCLKESFWNGNICMLDKLRLCLSNGNFLLRKQLHIGSNE